MAADNLLWDMPLYLGIITSVFFLINYKHFSKLGLIAGWFVVFTLGCELTGYYLAKIKANNIFLVHVYTLGAFIFCGLFFQRLFRLLNWDYIKNTYLYIGVILIILNSIFLQDISTFNSYSKTASQLIIITLCIIAYSLMTLKSNVFEERESVKVFIAAILLSSAMSISIYLFSNQIEGMAESAQLTIWMINMFINSLVQLLFIYGFYKRLKLNKEAAKI